GGCLFAPGRGRRAAAARGPVHLAPDVLAQTARSGRACGTRATAGGRGPADPRDARIAALERRAERAEAELEKARRVIEVQGNVSALLGELLAPKGAPGNTER